MLHWIDDGMPDHLENQLINIARALRTKYPYLTRERIDKYTGFLETEFNKYNIKQYSGGKATSAPGGRNIIAEYGDLLNDDNRRVRIYQQGANLKDMNFTQLNIMSAMDTTVRAKFRKFDRESRKDMAKIEYWIHCGMPREMSPYILKRKYGPAGTSDLATKNYLVHFRKRAARPAKDNQERVIKKLKPLRWRGGIFQHVNAKRSVQHQTCINCPSRVDTKCSSI